MSGFVAMFFGGFLDQIKNYDWKKKVQSAGSLTPFATHVTFIFTMFVLKTRK